MWVFFCYTVPIGRSLWNQYISITTPALLRLRECMLSPSHHVSHQPKSERRVYNNLFVYLNEDGRYPPPLHGVKSIRRICISTAICIGIRIPMQSPNPIFSINYGLIRCSNRSGISFRKDMPSMTLWPTRNLCHFPRRRREQ